VFRLEKDEKYLSAFDKDKLVYISPIKREKENAGRCKLKGGEHYVIVCSLENCQARNEFHLSVYFNDLLRNVGVKRVFHPEDKNKNKEEILPVFIPEESEKSFKNTPLWKV
jgi:hypothetical protein